MIAFFYLFDLFKNLLIILISYNSFEYGGDKSFGTIVNINLEFMRIIVFLNTFPNAII